MNGEARHAVVTALLGLAGSDDDRDRAAAGRGLAIFAETAEARSALVTLVLDADSRFVTQETAEALLRRHDSDGLTVVAAALAVGDPGYADWIYAAVVEVFVVYARDRDAAVRSCELLTRDPDEQVRRGAGELIGMLAGINPILHPVPGDETSCAG